MTPIVKPLQARASEIAAQIEHTVIYRIANDQLVLPSITAVAMRCLRLLQNPDFAIRDAVSIIECDPMLTAQLIKVCNSAALTRREPVRSVAQAVTRLGSVKVRKFLLETSVRTVCESRDKRISESFRGLWEHSIAVATMAREIATCMSGADPELAYLGGLLHDIGKPVVASMLLEAEKAVIGGREAGAWLTAPDWMQIIQRVHRNVGVCLAEKWEMPAEVCRGIRNCEEYDTTDRLSVSNAVLLANAIAKQEGVYVGDTDMDDVIGIIIVGKSLLNLDDAFVKRLATKLQTTMDDQLPWEPGP